MKIYRVEMMDRISYHECMTGGYNYKVIYYDVEAKNKEQALQIAKKDNPSYFLNEGYVREVDKVEYTTNEKDRLIDYIATLEKSLALAKEDLKKFE